MSDWQPQGRKLQELFHKICMSTVSNLVSRDFLSTLFLLVTIVFHKTHVMKVTTNNAKE
jgi:hypothetical protein